MKPVLHKNTNTNGEICANDGRSLAADGCAMVDVVTIRTSRAIG
jgi:hypothetical protein